MGTTTAECSSHHHQAVDRLGAGLRVTARAPDGIVEGIELDGDAWIVGAQWHPEDTAGRDPVQQSLFDTFVRDGSHVDRRDRSRSRASRPSGSGCAPWRDDDLDAYAALVRRSRGDALASARRATPLTPRRRRRTRSTGFRRRLGRRRLRPLVRGAARRPTSASASSGSRCPASSPRSSPASRSAGGSPGPCVGPGLATEGARAAMDFAFGPLGLDRIVSITRPENRNSWNVMQKLGHDPRAARRPTPSTASTSSSTSSTRPDGAGHRARAHGRRRPGPGVRRTRTSPSPTRPRSPASVRRSRLPAERMLDLACGPGRHHRPVRPGVPGRPRSSALEGSPAMLALGVQRVASRGARRPDRRSRTGCLPGRRTSPRSARSTRSIVHELAAPLPRPGRAVGLDARRGRDRRAACSSRTSCDPTSPARGPGARRPSTRPASPRCCAATSSTRCAPRSPPTRSAAAASSTLAGLAIGRPPH